MKTWVITTRAFMYEDYLKDLERTIVCKTKEEAKKVFDKECSSQGDWFWDGDIPYDRIFEDENTYVLISDVAHSVVTLREVEI